jgi:hypothetical protein
MMSVEDGDGLPYPVQQIRHLHLAAALEERKPGMLGWEGVLEAMQSALSVSM